MKVIGFRKSSFKGNDGTEVSGVNLYLTDKCEKARACPAIASMLWTRSWHPAAIHRS